MKIGILTLPLHTNYGGNLQAFALMTVLKEKGHDVWLINRKKNTLPAWKLAAAIVKRTISKFILRKNDVIIFKERKQRREDPIVNKNARQFIEKYIAPQTDPFFSSEALHEGIGKYKFDAVVVGSDQVWRPIYAPDIADYFFDFLPQTDTKTKRISYAASFGTSSWTFSSKETTACSALLQKFDAVGVREDAAVKMCKENLNFTDAVHVLDPTMLVDVSKYLALISESELQKENAGLFVYILDNGESKINVMNQISTELSIELFRIDLKDQSKEGTLEDRIARPVEDWIKAFNDAEYILTDSFHACVFSILFNKPFIVYGNADRGLARFDSLLKMFGLQNRLITSADMLTTDIINEKINWEKVNDILKIEKINSTNFLLNALGNEA